MTKKAITDKQKQTARYAKALGHPVRVAILQMLSKQACCYHGDMSEILPVAKSTLSQHLNELKDAGLLTRIIGLRPDNALTIYLNNRIAEKQAALFSIPYGIKTGKRNLSQAVRMSAAKRL